MGLGGKRTVVIVLSAAALSVTACSASTTGPSGGGGGGASSAPAAQGPINVLDILPPGNPPSTNELKMYDALNTIDPTGLTDSQLSDYYKSAPLDPAPADVAKTENPKSGVTIKRDKAGIPYVYGTTDNDTAWGAGYAGTEDRMFVMDALRYAGSGRYSELLGASKDNLAQDADLLRQADYTPAEANAQIDALANSSAQGKDLVSRLDAFVDGVNAARKALCPVVTAPSCPTPYRLLKITPTPYTPADVVFAGSLLGGVYGKGGGQEAQNALFLRQLQKQVGDVMARSVLNDLADPLDPNAVVTDPGQQAYGQPSKVDPAAVALPDLPGGDVKIAAGTGGIPSGATPPSGAGAGGGPTLLDALQMPAHMSNAMLVSGSHTTSGHPIAVMGPQTAYQSPNFWDEIALHGPHYDARGVSFVNNQFVVEIGHGKSYAWSATSSSGDVVDTVLDKLCNTDGSKATINSTAYLNGDKCEPMTGTPHQIHDNTGKLIATLPDMRTRHGIVQYRTTADGTAVAVVSERSSYNHDIDPVLAFAEMNDPTLIHGPSDFIAAFSKQILTFNWFYIDTQNIATFSSGLLPIRAKGVDPDLPRWGDAKWDWQGFIPASQHAQVVNPSSGFIVNWNNKPAVGVYSADDEWGWGPVARVLALRDRIEASIKAGKLTRATLAGDMIDAATVDVRGAYVLKDMLAAVGDDPALRQYTDLLQSWMNSGAHRVDRARTGHYADQAAIALMDVWYPLVAKEVLRPRLGSLVDAIPTSLDDLPSRGRGSSFDNVGSYQWVTKDLESVLGQNVDGAMSQKYCGKGDLTTCRNDIRQTLQQAVNALNSKQHTTDPTKWTYDKTQDDIKFQYVGESVDPIDWQNRPTFQQVIG
jgi:acyl-homoserine lactone acylase PvdQ